LAVRVVFPFAATGCAGRERHRIRLRHSTIKTKCEEFWI
jgi:hypothetical protein